MLIIVFCSYPSSNCPSRDSLWAADNCHLSSVSLSLTLSALSVIPPTVSSSSSPSSWRHHSSRDRSVIASPSPPLGSTSSLCRSEERPYLDRVRWERNGARLTYSSLPSLVEPSLRSAEVAHATFSYSFLDPQSPRYSFTILLLLIEHLGHKNSAP